jgi:hypothetical protein
LNVAQFGSQKGDLRGAAERLERGIDKYGEGDLAGALVEFEEALKLYPGLQRGRQFVAWVRDVQTGKRRINGRKTPTLDEDMLRAVDDALAPSSPSKLSSPAALAPTLDVESPWDPVPLTPEPIAEPPAGVLAARARAATSPTLLGMPPLEPKMLARDNKKRTRVAEDRPESVTREFRAANPTNPNLQPLDVPELTDEQIQALLALDSPLLSDGRTTPEVDLERLDHLEAADRLVELEPVAAPLESAPTAERPKRKDDTTIGVSGIEADFDPQSLTPTGIKPQGLKAVRDSDPDDDPYADLNLLPLEVAGDLAAPDEGEEGGTNPTHPFIRGPKLAGYTSFQPGSEPTLEDMPPLPSRPGGAGGKPGQPLADAEAALQAGDLAGAVDACEAALAPTGGLGGVVARDHLPLVEQIYCAILIAPDRVPMHGEAVSDLEPRSAFLLSRVDGAMTVEAVLDVSGMPRLEALRTLALLVRRGALRIK